MPRPRKPHKSDKPAAQANPVPLDMAAAPRAAQALRLRRLGYTYTEIAERVGYKEESGARKAIKQASKKIIRDEARELVGWQLDQLDIALQLVLQRIQRNDEYSLFAVDRLAPLLKRQAELMGLDAPKVDPASVQPIRREYVGVLLEAV